MQPLEAKQVDEANARKASRAQFIIYLVMFAFMALPFLIAWLTGAVRFEP